MHIAKHVFEYLKGTIEHKIIFNRGNGFAIFGFIDLDCVRDQH
jgi:hypothetical protein